MLLICCRCCSCCIFCICVCCCRINVIWCLSPTMDLLPMMVCIGKSWSQLGFPGGGRIIWDLATFIAASPCWSWRYQHSSPAYPLLQFLSRKYLQIILHAHGENLLAVFTCEYSYVLLRTLNSLLEHMYPVHIPTQYPPLIFLFVALLIWRMVTIPFVVLLVPSWSCWLFHCPFLSLLCPCLHLLVPALSLDISFLICRLP